MTVKNEKITMEKEELVDDITNTEEQLDNDKLSTLKAKMAAKSGENMPPKIVQKKTRSIKVGVVGSGQAGSRLSETFYKLGHDAVCINTATQDLEYIEMPDANKLLLDFGLGGAGKDLSIGHQAAETYQDSIRTLVNKRLSDAQLLLFCTSLGGGSGAGSAEVMVELLTQMDRPVGVICVLPMSTDDSQTKHNALVTLSKFTHMLQNKKIDNLIVVDNAKIEAIYSDVSQLDFFKVSNDAIVDPIDKFNTLSSMPSSIKGLDPTEFGKLFTDGQGLTCYGSMKVANYEEETSLAEAVIENLKDNLLASGFNLKESRYVGAIFTAPKRVWDKIPSASVNYAMSMIQDFCGSPLGLFRGIYVVDSDEDVVNVYSMFSGLSLPEDRVAQLKQEAKEKMAQVSQKDEQRNLNLKLDAGEATVNAAQAVKDRIAAKKSSFGKLHNNAVIDRRKK